MNDSFALQLALSFVTGSIWITLLTVLAERFGTKLGGVIAGIPATMVVSLLFIGVTQSADRAAQATTIIPLAVGLNALFVVLYIFLARRTTWALALVISLAAWSMAASALLLVRPDGIVPPLIGYFVCAAAAYYVLTAVFAIRSRAGQRLIYTGAQLAFRSFFGGAVIMLSVLMAHVSGPLFGGILSSFPALTVALIVTLQRTHADASYTEALLKDFIIIGTAAVVVFVLAVRLSYPSMGLIAGTAVSLVLSMGVSYGGFCFSRS